MKDRKNPLLNIIEFTGSRAWVARTNSAMNELQGSLSDLEAFEECYAMFSPRKVTPLNREEYKKALEENVLDKLAECLLMLEGLGAIFGEERVADRVTEKGRELFKRYEEELDTCVSVAEFMKKLGKELNVESKQKSRPKEI